MQLAIFYAVYTYGLFRWSPPIPLLSVYCGTASTLADGTVWLCPFADCLVVRSCLVAPALHRRSRTPAARRRADFCAVTAPRCVQSCPRICAVCPDSDTVRCRRRVRNVSWLRRVQCFGQRWPGRRVSVALCTCCSDWGPCMVAASNSRTVGWEFCRAWESACRTGERSCELEFN